MSFDFTDKTAVVTGGAQGIGRVITSELLNAGARVWIADCDEEAGFETVAELANLGQVEFVLTDVSNANAIDKLSQQVENCNGLNLLVNNAAIMTRKSIAELSLAEWQRVLDVNLTGPFLCSRAFAPQLAHCRGSIINIASTRALMSEPHTESYAASKGGLVALTHAMAMSLGPAVRVNCISPGWIDVSCIAKRSCRYPVRLTDIDHAQHPVGRVGQPEDIANLILYLASDEASFITGENVVVDGGMTKKMLYLDS